MNNKNTATFFRDKDRYLEAEKIIQSVCYTCLFETSAVRGKSRVGGVALVRQIIMYLLRMNTRLTLGEIGALLGNRTPATVSYGIQKIVDTTKQGSFLRRFIDSLNDELQEQDIQQNTSPQPQYPAGSQSCHIPCTSSQQLR